MFTSLQSSSSGYGDKFTVSENAGSGLNSASKSESDFFKLGKTMRHLYLLLTRNLMGNAQTAPKFVNAMDCLRIGRFRTARYAVTMSLLIHVRGGLFAHDMVDEVLVPKSLQNLKANCNIARAMLKMKAIISKTIINHTCIKSEMGLEKRVRIVKGGQLWLERNKKAIPANKTAVDVTKRSSQKESAGQK
ncbi:hypothetical protein HDU80_010376 [Chytriomyces hyalinus]|nr:hypothetical protein HDU80_010376 [Chytriomyces hyalinus]